MGIEALVLGMGETMQKMAYSQDRMEIRITDLEDRLSKRIYYLENEWGKTASEVMELEEALTNQEHTIREQEKDIVTLKLQVQGLVSDSFKLMGAVYRRDTGRSETVSDPVPTVAEPVSEYSRYDPARGY